MRKVGAYGRREVAESTSPAHILIPVVKPQFDERTTQRVAEVCPWRLSCGRICSACEREIWR